MADRPFFFEYRNNDNNITPLLTQRKSRIESMTHSRVILQYHFQDLSLAQGKFSYKNVAEQPCIWSCAVGPVWQECQYVLQ